MVSAGIGKGPEWLMFQHDLMRQSSLCDAPLSSTESSDQKDYFKINPNPCTNYFEIETDFSGIAELRNIDGIPVQKIDIKNNKTHVNLIDHPSGVYCIFLNTTNGILVNKLVIH